MKTVGIIAEFNPFHKGHEYLIRKAREDLNADRCAVVMSGSFTQRGEPACIYKYDRVKAALMCGADAVFELPCAYSTASAEAFAYGGISILDSLGCIDAFAFGSESGSISELSEAADALCAPSHDRQEVIRAALKTGMTYPAARAAAYPEYSNCLSDPNNILGIEYLKAARKLGSDMVPYTVRRLGAGYHEDTVSTNELPSAESIRNSLKNRKSDEGHSIQSELPGILSEAIPSAALGILTESLRNYGLFGAEDIAMFTDYALFSQTVNEMAQWQDMNEDIARRFRKCLGQYNDTASMLTAMKTKELTYSRLSRCLLHIILRQEDLIHTDKGELLPCPCTRLLGFRKEASELMHEIAGKSSIPIITKAADAGDILSGKALAVYEQNAHADSFFDLIILKKYGIHAADGYRISPVII